ncbi:MAG: YicC family protein [Candidatus Accumulibacter sp.]|nr:YicC family protein [Accumulibacter sp.]
MTHCKDKLPSEGASLPRTGTIHSMTGYTARIRDAGFGVINFEIKSVNSRYLDFQFRICDELRAIEPALRDLIGTRIRRGKVECKLGFSAPKSLDRTSSLNTDHLQRLKEFEARIRHELPEARPLAVDEVLRWPGILKDDSPEMDAVIPVCLALAEEALGDLTESRAREGAKLAIVILDRIACAREQVSKITPWIQAAQVSYQEKLKQRLTEALCAADDGNILREAVFFAARIDVAEEIARLTAHLDETERVIKTGGVCGKRLDFLMQELNREANTLGSKSMISEVSQMAIELKLLIEQMREQIQNLE